MNKYDVLQGPLITEKSTLRKEEQRTLCFRVRPDATKTDIRNAVEALFKVKVEDVRTANYPGKLRRQRRWMGYRPDWKKAYVKLKEGEKMVEYAQI
jgi:large subunit ribosomal protein L23